MNTLLKAGQVNISMIMLLVLVQVNFHCDYMVSMFLLKNTTSNCTSNKNMNEKFLFLITGSETNKIKQFNY